MWNLESSSNGQEDRVFSAGDDGGEQLMLAQHSPRPIVFIRTRADQSVRPGQ